MTDPSGPPAPDPGRRWLGGPRSTAVAAAIVLLVVALAAIWLWWPRQGAPAEDPPVAAIPSARGSAMSDQPAQTPAADRSLSTSAPRGIAWQSWHAFALPYSQTAGPRHVEGQVASGFAHTPVGALIASVHSVARLAVALDPGWQDVIESMAAPGPGRDAWVKARRAVTITQTPAPGSLAQIAGFQFTAYTPSDAVVQLVTRSSDSSLSMGTIHMTWQDDDWRLVLVAGGGTTVTRQPLPSLDGFIAWGAVQ